MANHTTNGIIRHSKAKHGVTRCDGMYNDNVSGVTQVLRGVVLRGVAWCGMAWRGVEWCGGVQCGIAWHGVAWRGMA